MLEVQESSDRLAMFGLDGDSSDSHNESSIIELHNASSFYRQ